jgi:hypothetical protein
VVVYPQESAEETLRSARSAEGLAEGTVPLPAQWPAEASPGGSPGGSARGSAENPPLAHWTAPPRISADAIRRSVGAD